MRGYLAVLAASVMSVPAMAQTTPQQTPQTITIKDPYGMWWSGKWTCRITDQGGVPSKGEGNSIEIKPGTNGIKFTASHTYSTGYAWGIRSYNACNYGAGRGVKSTPSLAIKVTEIGDLVQPFSFTVDRKSGDFNILIEAFPTSTPTDMGWGNLEIGFQLYNNKSLNDWLKRKCSKTAAPPCKPGAYIAKAKGTFTDKQGITWIVVLAPGPVGPLGYAIIKPLKPISSGLIPWGEAITWLIKAKILNPNSYMQGAFAGIEVVNGTASISFDLGAIR